MTFGNIKSERPDLRSLFGPLTSEENTLLLERLIAVDVRLTQLAEHATRHVGVPYKPLGLGMVVRSDGSNAGIHGGPSGNAGDIWFDISPTWSPAKGTPDFSSWEVVSRIVVFCSDHPERRGDPNTHDLLRLDGVAKSPKGTLELLESHVSIIEQQLDQYPTEKFTSTPHAELP